MTTVFGTARSDRRLWPMLAVALLAHALLILGVRFQTDPPQTLKKPTLRVALVNAPNRIQPDEHSPEAGADHLGGGMPTKEATAPQERRAAQVPAPKSAEETALQQQARAESMLEAVEPSSRVQPPDNAPVLDTEAESMAIPRPEPQPKTAERPRAKASELIRQARRLARAAPGSALPISRGDAPKSHGASTRFSVAEAYIEDWVRKVQDWGTRNFPAQARKQRLQGQLRLSVVLRFDGRVQAITLLQSSGHATLDQAAVDIVELAAPYAPFPEALRSGYGDFLTVDRTWQFVHGNRLTSP